MPDKTYTKEMLKEDDKKNDDIDEAEIPIEKPSDEDYLSIFSSKPRRDVIRAIQKREYEYGADRATTALISKEVGLAETTIRYHISLLAKFGFIEISLEPDMESKTFKTFYSLNLEGRLAIDKYFKIIINNILEDFSDDEVHSFLQNVFENQKIANLLLSAVEKSGRPVIFNEYNLNAGLEAVHYDFAILPEKFSKKWEDNKLENFIK